MLKLFFILSFFNILLLGKMNVLIVSTASGKVVYKEKVKISKNIIPIVEKNKEWIFPSIEELNKNIITVNYNKLIKNAKKYLGGVYLWGGTKPGGFDCSGYVKYLYEKEGFLVPRTALQQSKVSISVEKKNLQKGDLLFFKTTDKRKIPITHVGIYIGNSKFIHAASRKKGIIISSINGSYKNKFVKAKRFSFI